jgi:hypothetical protein
MSTFYDCHYRCEGDSKLVAKAVAVIEALQNKHPEVRGSTHCHIHNEVEVAKNGESMNWTSYTKGFLDGLDVKLTKLTAKGDLKLFIYQGCTDGTNEGRLLRIVGGKLISDIDCEADIGLQALLDIVALQAAPDSQALSRLIAGFKDATNFWHPSTYKADKAVVVQQEDDEDEDDDEDDGDYSDITRAGVLAAMIGDTIDMYPAMLDMPVHSDALLSLGVKVNMARHYMFKFKLASKPVQHGINALIATVEKLTLSEAIAKPKAKTAVSTRQAVRL